MAEMVPQAVLDYYKGYDPLWWAKGVDPSSLGGWYNSPTGDRYTDASGYQWMPNMTGGEGGLESGAMQSLSGYRRALNPGENVGQGETTNLFYKPDGSFSHDYFDEKGWLNPFTGILAVATLGAGAQYLAAANAAGVGAGAGAGAGAGTAAGTGAGTGAAVGSGAGFVGEGALSGIGAWDAAMAGAPAWSAGGTAAMGAGAGMGELGGSGAGFVGEGAASGIPAWDAAAGSGVAGASGAGGAMDWAKMLSGNGGFGDYAKLASTALGAYGGSQGVNNEQTTQNRMDPRLDPYLYGDLFPRAQGLLGQQFGQAQAQSGAMNNVGMGLLNTNPNPDLASNPYLTGVANDIQRRTGDLLGQNFNNIRGNSIMSGTLGGSRQGVAEGEAMKGAADSMQGQLSNLFYGAYNQDANRNLSKIGMGAGLLGQSQQAGFAPLNSASDIYRPYTGLNSSMTTGGNVGGGWMGALGGALGGAQWAQNMWGGK